ncbi:MAG TPA: zinc ABC transporter substrate-binding protein [Acidimicrobiales bacterium]|nr:zinc ABC transporter substrate-binding protein [Acidimicrobiales bacterium]
MRIVLILSLVAGAALAGCGEDETGPRSPTAGAPLSVAASFHPLAEVAERVGGTRVAVANLTPAGAEPHDLELSTRQVEQVEDADLAIVLGRGFQPSVERVAARRRGPTIVALDAIGVEEGEIEGHDEDEDEDDHDDGGGLDPHVWLDPTRMAAITEHVADALADIDPDGAATYRANGADFLRDLDALDRRYETGLAECDRDVIVVAHAAFGWLAQRYGLRQEAVAGLSPDQEPDPRRLDALVDLVRDEGVTTIFSEVLVSPRVAETLAREAGVATAVLDPIEGIAPERLDEGETYLSVMDRNLDELRAALGCR